MNKVTLFLMSEKGYAVLQGILSSFNPEIIDCIITSKDKDVQNDFFEEISTLARKNNINVLEKEETYQVKTNYAIAISWRWLINFENKNVQLLVLHDSLLPKYRGFAPLVNQLINKEKRVGVTAIFANKEFDKGNIIRQKELTIAYPIKINELISKITSLYQQIIIEILNSIIKGVRLKEIEQKESEATYSLWRDENDYKVNWNEDAEKIKRFIDAVGYPYQGASTKMDEQFIKILDSEVEEDVLIENRTPGKVLFVRENNYPVVVCGKGLLKITVAVNIKDGNTILPLKKFRTKFS